MVTDVVLIASDAPSMFDELLLDATQPLELGASILQYPHSAWRGEARRGAAGCGKESASAALFKYLFYSFVNTLCAVLSVRAASIGHFGSGYRSEFLLSNYRI